MIEEENWLYVEMKIKNCIKEKKCFHLVNIILRRSFVGTIVVRLYGDAWFHTFALGPQLYYVSQNYQLGPPITLSKIKL